MKKAPLDPVRKKENFLVFGAPAIEQAEIDEVARTMESGWLGTGPRVAEFETRMKEYKGAQFAIAVNSCTAALHLALVASDLEPGDEVITTPMTFCATVNAILHSGGTPVLADIDPETKNIDPEAIREKLTSRTKAIVPVHFAGGACDMAEIMQIADEYGLRVIEDCAHAIETEYENRKAGVIGNFGCFSFYVTKNIVTGEGGMVLTQDEALAERVRRLSLHGMSKDAWQRFGSSGYRHYQVVEAGFKYNMPDIQAAIGVHQLERIEPYWKRRCEVWERYDAALSNLPVGRPSLGPDRNRHARHLYTIYVDEAECGLSRDAFLESMTQQGIGVGVHYLSVPEHPYYIDRFGWNVDQYPHARDTGRQTVSLPISARLSDRDVDDVILAVERVLSSAQ